MDLQEFSEQVLVPFLGLALVPALPLFELFLCQAAAAELCRSSPACSCCCSENQVLSSHTKADIFVMAQVPSSD